MTKKQWRSYSTHQSSLTAIKKYLPEVTNIPALMKYRDQIKELLVQRQLEIENKDARQQNSHNANPDKYP